MGYRIVVKNIERLADHAVSLSKDILDFENPIPGKIIDKIQEMSDFSLNVIDDTCLALFKNDYAGAEKAIAESHNVLKYEKKVLDLLKSIKDEETSFRV